MKIDYEITVDVSDADIETKKRVQDAFFELGIVWYTKGKKHSYLDKHTYTNVYAVYAEDYVDKYLYFSELRLPATHTPEELFELAGMKTETKLIPFDLEKALAGDPVITRDGQHVTQVTAFNFENEYDELIAGVVGGHLVICHKDGKVDPVLDSQYDLFMKPKTRIVNGFEVPSPVKTPPKSFDYYYIPSVQSDVFYCPYVWSGDIFDKKCLERGLVFLTKEDAAATAKAMLGIDPYEGVA